MSVGAAQLQSSTTQMRMAGLRSDQIYLAQKKRIDPDDPATWPTVAALGDLSGLRAARSRTTPTASICGA